MEGLADFAFSLSKLAGGFAGHHSTKRRALATAGYGVTAIATAAIARAKRSVLLLACTKLRYAIFNIIAIRMAYSFSCIASAGRICAACRAA